jgi:chemotaxis protein histidine kinase CheA
MANTNNNRRNQNAFTPQEREERQWAFMERQQRLLNDNRGRSQVIVQNIGETRELARLSIDLDKRFSYVRANMFGRLPGEYGMLSLNDLQEAIAGLKGVEERLSIFGVKRNAGGNANANKLNPERIKRFHYEKLKAFADQGAKLLESLKALGIEGEAVSQSLKEALSDYEAKLQEERDRIAKEQEEARIAKAEEKAKKKAEWEARQEEIAKQKRLAQEGKAKSGDDQSEAINADTPSLTGTSDQEQGTKPSKAKKEKVA